MCSGLTTNDIVTEPLGDGIDNDLQRRFSNDHERSSEPVLANVSTGRDLTSDDISMKEPLGDVGSGLQLFLSNIKRHLQDVNERLKDDKYMCFDVRAARLVVVYSVYAEPALERYSALQLAVAAGLLAALHKHKGNTQDERVDPFHRKEFAKIAGCETLDGAAMLLYEVQCVECDNMFDLGDNVFLRSPLQFQQNSYKDA
eukprot:TRINITY_DN15894_c0_g1_i1.p1 TRINITY_DN15894_c0_g1~~TRINITY_DN15894_c0_g1_i1.p1  ORF type:complete len:200 (-),score=23.98 TRINITY_DN15894_c0_g1_i1:2-601(-)